MKKLTYESLKIICGSFVSDHREKNKKSGCSKKSVYNFFIIASHAFLTAVLLFVVFPEALKFASAAEFCGCLSLVLLPCSGRPVGTDFPHLFLRTTGIFSESGWMNL